MITLTDPWLQNRASQRVCAVLTDAGFQAWFVGGCVRNAVIGAPVSDLDLSTDAHPEMVMKLARAAGIKAIPTGIDHGTVTLIADQVPYEITTFRRDVATDGRRATVAFADNMTDDARRRDFTINALYADPNGVICDPLGGLPDLNARRVRFIEDPSQRIKEDYLRILRFFRFYAWYGDPSDGPDAESLAACAENIDGLADLSKERVTAEILKLLAASDPAPAVAAMAATGALGQLMPGAAPEALSVLVHLEQETNTPPCPIRRLAVLGGEATDNLRLSNVQSGKLAQIMNDQSATETAYRNGAAAGRDKVLIIAASLGQPLAKDAFAAVDHAAAAKFPLKAADLMPDLTGPALGQALKRAEARWIASGFSLTKGDLLD